jgi:hypothetical protein
MAILSVLATLTMPYAGIAHPRMAVDQRDLRAYP